MDNFTLHINSFADRVRAMNQMRSPELRLTPTDANNLLADITQVLAQVAAANQRTETDPNAVIEVRMDGGSF
jgi:uncharacterized lipoprotein YajG